MSLGNQQIIKGWQDSAFARLVEILLPAGGVTVIMYEGYFDESGDADKDPHIFGLAGYYIESGRAKMMDLAWGATLARYGIPYFHMVDCAHGNGVFSKMSSESRIALVKELIEQIKIFTFEGFAVLCHGSLFSPSESFPDVYSFGVSQCITATKSHMEMTGISNNMACFFESGHKNKANALRLVAKQIEQVGASITFANKKELHLLQAADLLAWQSIKYAKDQFLNTRPPRKDFVSLMEHPHALAYSAIDREGKVTLAFHFWPESRRTQQTLGITADTSGPITLVFANNDKTPMIQVGMPLSIHSFGGGAVHVKFSQLANDTPFALSFNETRLREAVGALIRASGVFPKTKPIVFAPGSIGVQKTNDGVLIGATLSEGAKIALHLPRDAVKYLIANLQSSLN